MTCSTTWLLSIPSWIYSRVIFSIFSPWLQHHLSSWSPWFHRSCFGWATTYGEDTGRMLWLRRLLSCSALALGILSFAIPCYSHHLKVNVQGQYSIRMALLTATRLVLWCMVSSRSKVVTMRDLCPCCSHDYCLDSTYGFFVSVDVKNAFLNGDLWGEV